jgi:hypothetical protein
VDESIHGTKKSRMQAVADKPMQPPVQYPVPTKLIFVLYDLYVNRYQPQDMPTGPIPIWALSSVSLELVY